MIWFIFFIAILITIVCFALSSKADDKDHMITALTCFVLGGFFVVVSVFSFIAALTWNDTMLNIDIRRETVAAERAVYIELMKNYEERLVNQDITESQTYMNVCKEVLDFNTYVLQAKKWKDTWWAGGLMYDPAYTEVDIIPINTN